ncbi:hypothetical protein MMYC01_205385 [Madurella mycetomatis]|uniref:Uncharacterized protein n=1 Tax=Madurella mycetomatis TaxID=100816 RepID=A0A175W1I3_9PEZI|nr:hypothetical protein MMYC01_205385 [Madurella mycetomatis]
MRFSATLTSLALFAGAAFAAPAEKAAMTARDIPESIAKAMELGIDVYGPIPDDAQRVDDHWVAQPGSRASAWMRAQIDLDQYEADQGEQVEKRQWANIGIGLWAQDNCQGESAWFDNVEYNVHHVTGVNMFAVGIRYRGLRNGEHLDFSRWANGDLCGQYVASAAVPSTTGCANIPLTNCFHLWL